MPALLDLRLAAVHHLLVLDSSCTSEQVAALARSRYPDGSWTRQDELTLEESVVLTGPWPLDHNLRSIMDLPAWSAQAWVCLVPHERAGPLPPGLAGTDPILDAYPHAIPHGVELYTLRFLHAVARRLAGAVHLAGTGVILIPDPGSAVDLTVYGPSLFSVATLAAVTGRADAISDGVAATSWSASMLAVPGNEESGQIQVIHEPCEVPFALSGMEWADAAYGTAVRWNPPEWARGGRIHRAQRELRAEVIRQVEAVAAGIVAHTGGAVVDEDGFVVTL